MKEPKNCHKEDKANSPYTISFQIGTRHVNENYYNTLLNEVETRLYLSAPNTPQPRTMCAHSYGAMGRTHPKFLHRPNQDSGSVLDVS